MHSTVEFNITVELSTCFYTESAWTTSISKILLPQGNNKLKRCDYVYVRGKLEGTIHEIKFCSQGIVMPRTNIYIVL